MAGQQSNFRHGTPLERARCSDYRIEGEYVSMADIAKRLRVKEATAKSRLSKLRGASGAITWARLGAAA